MESNKGERTQTTDIRDFGIANNQAIVCISNFNGESMIVHYFPFKDGSHHKSYDIKETTAMKFYYPVITIVKGSNEVMLYNITESLYYYIKLNSPMLLQTSTLSNSYGPELKGFFDLGDFLYFAQFSFSVGSNPYFSSTLYKAFLPKSEFPDSKLLAGFDYVKVKFLSKEEDAYTLQFTNSLMCFGNLTPGLTQIYDLNYEKGELLMLSYDSFFIWNKGGKSVNFKTIPVNFNETMTDRVLFESSDYIKSIK